MFIVVESHIIAIVRINAGGGNDRTSKVTADVFYDRVSAAESWFGVDIEAIFIFFVNGSLGLFKRRTDMQFHFIQQGGLESFAEVSIAEVFHNLPEDKVVRYVRSKFAITIIEMKSQTGLSTQQNPEWKRRCTVTASFFRGKIRFKEGTA